MERSGRSGQGAPIETSGGMSRVWMVACTSSAPLWAALVGWGMTTGGKRGECDSDKWSRRRLSERTKGRGR